MLQRVRAETPGLLPTATDAKRAKVKSPNRENQKPGLTPRSPVQSREILLAEAEEIGGEEGRPFPDAIDRLAGHEEIGEENEQGGNGREFGT